MQADKNILDELGTISPVVAGIGQATTYSVPNGYFEGFAGSLMARIGAIELIPAILAGLHSETEYVVPVGFFDGFAEKLMRRIKAEEAGSAGEELEILSPLLSRLEKKEPFAAPAGYFSELPGNLVAELQALRFVTDELEKNDEPEQTGEPEILSPLMDGLKNIQAYSVPEGYFDTLAQELSSRVIREGADLKSGEPKEGGVKEAGARVVSMNRGRMRGWMKYAVAAALTGLLVTAGIRVYYNGKPSFATAGANGDSTNVKTNLAKVSDQEILNYLENQNEPLAEAATNSMATLDINNDSDVKDFLGDVPDAELTQYMDEHGASKDPLTN